MMVKRVKMFADSQLFYFGVASSLINIRIYSMSIISIIYRDPTNTWNGRGFCWGVDHASNRSTSPSITSGYNMK
jgi:hypothetical protein